MRKPIDERAPFAAAYRDGLGLAAIAVIAGGQGACIAAPADAAAMSETEGLHAVWWCRRADDAARLAASARGMVRRESCDGETPALARAEAAVAAAAQKLNIALYSDADIAAQAMQVAARVDAELRLQQSSGGLKSLNKSYRAYRLATSGRGERVLRYDAWMLQYRETLVRQIAVALRQF